MKKLLLALGFAVATTGAAVSFAQADTLSTVKDRGALNCGVSTGYPGFSQPDSQGVYQGFDADYCRAFAAAVLGDSGKVHFVPLTAPNRFTSLQSGEIDVLNRNSTQTFTRGSTLGLVQGPINFYDGQGFAVRKDIGVENVVDLDGASVCAVQGTTHEATLGDFARANGISWEVIVFDRPDVMFQAFFAGRCDAVTQDSSTVAANVANAPNPDDYMLLEQLISKEPFGSFTRSNDQAWSNIIAQIHYGLVEAEELGITQANVDEMLNSDNITVRRLLGDSDNFGSKIGLDDKWMYNVIKAVGNYGEIYQRNLGEESTIKLSRGLNRLWNDGGLVYAIPFR